MFGSGQSPHNSGQWCEKTTHTKLKPIMLPVTPYVDTYLTENYIYNQGNYGLSNSKKYFFLFDSYNNDKTYIICLVPLS